MFGRGYFGGRYFGARYFGGGSDAAAAAGTGGRWERLLSGVTPAPTFLKNAASSRRYGIDVVDVLHPGDAVSGVTTMSSAGISVDQAAYAGTVLSARASGGTPGFTYALTFAWATLQGDTDHRTIHIAVA